MAVGEKYEVLMRLRAIELVAYWEGRLNTQHLVSRFGITRQQATNDIKRYLTGCNPGALRYSPEQKGYLPTEQFRPVLTQGHINEYMDLLSGLVSQTIPVTLIPEPHIAAVHLPDRAVRPEVVRQLIRACRKQQVVQITYASMNHPKPHKRLLSPHSLIYTGFRWHVRGFCQKTAEYRDFVISRISEIVVVDGQYVDMANDADWNEEIELEIIPNRNLSKPQQALIAKVFVMEKGRLLLKVKKALVFYTLQRYQIATEASHLNNPLAFPLELANHVNLAHCLLRTE